MILPLLLGLGGMTGVLAWAHKSGFIYRPANGAALPANLPYVPAPAPQAPQTTHQEVQQILLEPSLVQRLAAWLVKNLSKEQAIRVGTLLSQAAMARLGRFVPVRTLADAQLLSAQLELEDFCMPLSQVLNGEQIDLLDQELPQFKALLDKCVRNKAPMPGPVGPVVGPVQPAPAPAPYIPPPAPTPAPYIPPPAPTPGPVIGPIVGPVQPAPAPTPPYVPPAPTPAPYIAPVPADPTAGLVMVKAEDLMDVLNRQRGRNWSELKDSQGAELNTKIPAAFQAATLGLQMAVSGALPVAPQGVDRRILAVPRPGSSSPYALDWMVSPAAMGALKANAEQPKPVPAPVPAPPSATQTLQVAAVALRTFLTKNPTPEAFGYKGHASQPVKDFQTLAQKGGFPKLKVDGILGPEVRKAGASVNVTFPDRPTATQPLKPTPAAVVVQPKPAPAPVPAPVVVVKPPSSAPGFDPARASALAPGVAANIKAKSFNYDRNGLKAFQAAAGIPTDGVYGGQSMGALRFYLGGAVPPKALFAPTPEQAYVPPGAAVKPVPAVVQPPVLQPAVIAPPVIAPAPIPAAAMQPQLAVVEPPSTPLQFAQVLRAHLQANPTPEAFGYKGHPSQPVKDFQRATGIAQDGILGPGVRKEGDKLGVRFPDRPATATSGAATPDQARALARRVVQELRSRGRAYNRQLMAVFQQAAGLPVTGEYDGRTRGALQTYGSQRAPRAMVGPQRAIPYQ